MHVRAFVQEVALVISGTTTPKVGQTGTSGDGGVGHGADSVESDSVKDNSKVLMLKPSLAGGLREWPTCRHGPPPDAGEYTAQQHAGPLSMEPAVPHVHALAVQGALAPLPQVLTR